MTPTRLVTLDDAPVLAALLRANRELLAPWEPIRPDDYFTEEGQRAVVEAALEQYERGFTVPHLILDEAGAPTGRITLNTIVRGPFQSCSIGYWLGAAATGRGLATNAVAHLVGLAFGELGLHRVEAGTLVHNTRSQGVLERNGFVRFGLAPSYLCIAGRWQDHVLYQRVHDDDVSPAGT